MRRWRVRSLPDGDADRDPDFKYIAKPERIAKSDHPTEPVANRVTDRNLDAECYFDFNADLNPQLDAKSDRVGERDGNRDADLEPDANSNGNLDAHGDPDFHSS